MKFVEDVKMWKRWWSMRLIIASTFFSSVIAVYATFPSDWLPEVASWIKGTLAVGAMATAATAGVARVIKQAPKD